MSQQLAIERRSQPRVRLERVTQVRILASNRHHTQWRNVSLEEGFLFDLSNAGAFVATDLALEKGSLITIEIATPGILFPAPLQAVVARRTDQYQSKDLVMPAGLGLQFVTQTTEEHKRISRIVMTTLTLDLLDFGYENKRTYDFWTDVLSKIRIPESEWRPPRCDQPRTPSNTESLQTLRLRPGPESGPDLVSF